MVHLLGCREACQTGLAESARQGGGVFLYAVILFSHTLKEVIHSRAKKLGFDLCCFTRPHLPDLHRTGYLSWIGASMHGEMGWMAETERAARRLAPEAMLDEVKTVITVAMRYTPPTYSLDQATTAKGRGVIATYAHGNDYHGLMKKRLKALARDLDLLLGLHEQRIYADTAPVLEHALAETSGLGWLGKHSLAINRNLGSWFLLGELFTTAEIEPDGPVSGHCGSCSACMDVCPTHAIVAPYVVDARLCISYLTIEHRGFIPRGLRAMMGNHIFGCDDCQATCPWNRHAVAPDQNCLNPREENSLPELASLLLLDEEEFRERFRKSPVRRTGRAGLLRNVCIAMGNSGNLNFAPLLLEVLEDDEPLIRGHAVWALEQLVDDSCLEELLCEIEPRTLIENNKKVLEELNISICNIREKHG